MVYIYLFVMFFLNFSLKLKFRESLEQRSESKEGILSSFEDGTRCKEHPLFSRNPKAIQICWNYIYNNVMSLNIANSMIREGAYLTY